MTRCVGPRELGMGCPWSRPSRNGESTQQVGGPSVVHHWQIGNANFGDNRGSLYQNNFFRGHGDGTGASDPTSSVSHQVGSFCNVPAFIPTAPAWGGRERTTEGYDLEPPQSSQSGPNGEANDGGDALDAPTMGESFDTQPHSRSHGDDEGCAARDGELQNPHPIVTINDPQEATESLDVVTAIAEGNTNDSRNDSTTALETQHEAKKEPESTPTEPKAENIHPESHTLDRGSPDIGITARTSVDANDPSRAPAKKADAPQSIPESSPNDGLVLDPKGAETLRKKEAKRMKRQEAEKARKKHAEQMYRRTHLYAD